jgi:hypothetical protein
VPPGVTACPKETLARRVSKLARAARLGVECGSRLALRPKIPARERFYADTRPARRGNAPLRQTGSTVGPVPFLDRSGFRREENGQSSQERAGELGERVGEPSRKFLERQTQEVDKPPPPKTAAACQRAPLLRAPTEDRSTSARQVRCCLWTARRRPSLPNRTVAAGFVQSSSRAGAGPVEGGTASTAPGR